MPGLSKEDKLRLLTVILESRHADLREQNLNRQGKGHFHVSGMGHEAFCFAKEKKLPLLFLVEDNGYGISMPTRKTNPLALDVLESDNWRQIEGQNVQQVYEATAEVFEKIRGGGGPFFFWVTMERLSSHTSSDDQKLYRSDEELRVLEKFDPLKCWKDQLIGEGMITAEEYAKLDEEIKERVRREYGEAETAEDPSPNELLATFTKAP